MIEIPESKTIGIQATETLIGKKVAEVVNATNPHRFAWYNGDPAEYDKLLTGRKVKAARGHGMFIDIIFDNNTYLTLGDGTILRYGKAGEKRPDKHQLLVGFDDSTFLVFTIAMYGGIWAYRDRFDNKYYQGSLNSVSPLEDAFNESYFDSIFKNTKKDFSAKAFLATEQRIPGVGNGVLQDILFNAGIHPRRRQSTLSDFEKSELFHSLKVTLADMTEKGGRDTEKDFFGNFGKYKTLLSRNTYKAPCPNCGGIIVKQAYLGGSVYFCPTCQRL